MMLEGRRTCKRVGMFLLVVFLFLRQTMFLNAKEPENTLAPYYSDIDELVEGITEKLATPEEDFVVYVPYLMVQSAEFDGLLKRLFPGVRIGNYYSSTVYSISISCSNQSDVKEGMVELNIEVKRTDSKEEQVEVLKQVKEIAKEIEKNALNDYEKIKMTHDFLAKNVEYVTGYDGAFNALLLGKSVCNGYAASFQLIMEELRIPSVMVCSNEINHAWNCVYLEGAWYNIDVTWDDDTEKTGLIYYQYFLKGQEDFWGHGEFSFSTARKAFIPNTSHVGLENGWKQEGEKKYYYMDDKLVTGWLFEHGNWYYFDKDGEMKTGWIKSAGKWYYLGESGEMKTGWIKSAGKWYYLGESGEMKTGWIKSAGIWYYLLDTGVMI